MGSSGIGTDVRAGLGTLPAAGGDGTALPDSAGLGDLRHGTGTTPEGTGAAGARPHSGTARQDGESLMRGYTVMGITLLFLGEFVAAHAHFEQGLASLMFRRPPALPAPRPGIHI